MGVNIILKKEEENFFQVECFDCRKKGYYANRYPQKRKEESKN